MEAVVATESVAATKPIDVDKLIAKLIQPDETHRSISFVDRIIAFRQLMSAGKIQTMVPALPLLFNLENRPYTLKDHYPFESIFRTELPRELLMKTGRQVAKSTSLAARGILISNAIPNFSTLFVAPLYEQIRRFSTNYVRKFIEQSPVKSLWIGTGTENSVLQRSFKNFSKMFFSFALTDADRIRGISAHACNFDEVQDMDRNLIPVIKETMSASKWRLSFYTGTPKTLDNTIQGLFDSSSQAEWVIPCRNCRYRNVPKMGYDLERMIGPWHDQISEHIPGTICANLKCRRPIYPRDGRWEHQVPNRRWTFPGYHIPQIIMPIHYADSVRWAELLAKMEGYGNFTTPQFYNEVLGESYDVGTKLVSQTELQAAAILPWHNVPDNPVEPLRIKNKYVLRVMGVDWGGGGEDEVSFTTIAVLGLCPDGKIDVIYGRRLLFPHLKVEVAQVCLQVFKMFDCHYFAHDFNGSGDVREAFMVQAGLPIELVVPIVYYRSAARNPMTIHKSDDKHSRNYWHLDKARSLQTVCQCIKLGGIRFFRYDFVNDQNRGLMHDFLALRENKIEVARGADIFTVQRNPAFSDDFAHAVCYAAATIWHRTDRWPNLVQMAQYRLTQQQEQLVSPSTPWQDFDAESKV